MKKETHSWFSKVDGYLGRSGRGSKLEKVLEGDAPSVFTLEA